MKKTLKKPRTRKGNWGVFGIRRGERDWEETRGGGVRLKHKIDEPVAKRRRGETLDTLKRRKKEREAEKREAELKRRTRLTKAEAELYEAKARKRKAKKQSSRWQPLPTKSIKVRRKKQGKRLSTRSRIRLI